MRKTTPTLTAYYASTGCIWDGLFFRFVFWARMSYCLTDTAWYRTETHFFLSLSLWSLWMCIFIRLSGIKPKQQTGEAEKKLINKLPSPAFVFFFNVVVGSAILHSAHVRVASAHTIGSHHVVSFAIFRFCFRMKLAEHCIWNYNSDLVRMFTSLRWQPRASEY